MKLHNLLTSFIFSITLTTSCLCTTPLQVKANAESLTNDIEPIGWYTSITLSLNSGEGKVWATAKNSFTLFPAIVQVYVELYYSYGFEESYQNMSLAAREYIGDLDQGDSLIATSSTNGETRYWKARVNFKKDDDAWKEQLTNTLLINGNGDIISN